MPRFVKQETASSALTWMAMARKPTAGLPLRRADLVRVQKGVGARQQRLHLASGSCLRTDLHPGFPRHTTCYPRGAHPSRLR